MNQEGAGVDSLIAMNQSFKPLTELAFALLNQPSTNFYTPMTHSLILQVVKNPVEALGRPSARSAKALSGKLEALS
jgi:hypothetical protein